METTIRSYSGELSPPSVAFVASVAVRHSSISVEDVRKQRVRAALGDDKIKSVCVMYGTEGAMTCAARNMARANECTKDKNECAKCTDKCEDAKDSEDCKKACGGTVECAPKCTPKANKCDEVTCPVKKTLR